MNNSLTVQTFISVFILFLLNSCATEDLTNERRIDPINVSQAEHYFNNN